MNEAVELTTREAVAVRTRQAVTVVVLLVLVGLVVDLAGRALGGWWASASFLWWPGFARAASTARRLGALP